MKAALRTDIVTTLDGDLRAAAWALVLDALGIHDLVESTLQCAIQGIFIDLNFNFDLVRHKCLFSPTAPHSIVKDKNGPHLGKQVQAKEKVSQ
jgi:hypothetical protein